MSRMIVGRKQELDALAQFVADLPGRLTALTIEGEPGVGKTVLWLEGVARAEAAGYRVCRSRPTEAETKLSFAALGDLLRDLVDPAVSSLPGPQRKALRLALLLDEAAGAPPDHHAVSLATLGVLEAAADAGPVVLAIDDAQWLDGPSARALQFALRRLRATSLGVLMTHRVERDSRDPPALDPSLFDVRRLRLGPLSLDELDRLLRQRLDGSFLRPTLRRLHRASGGNPFFALELARALACQEHGVQPGGPLPVPETLHELVRDRLAGLPASSRASLLAAAALSVPTRELVEATVGERRAAVGLARALEARVIELDDGRVRFDHPLLASVLYAEATEEERRRLHRRLAAVVGDAEERGRHLALAAVPPDAQTAAALEQAAEAARARAATDAAADLAEEAARFTPPGAAAALHRRALRAGGFAFEAGDTVRARRLLDVAVAAAPDGRARASALDSLARVWMFAADLRRARRLFEQALEAGHGDPALAAESQQGLAWALWLGREDARDAVRHARAAVRLAERTGDQALIARALAIRGVARCAVGERRARADLDRAVSLEDATAHLRVLRQPTFAWSIGALYMDDMQGARAASEELYRRARERGDEASIPPILCDFAEHAFLTGAWAEAVRRSDEAIEAAQQRGEDLIRARTLWLRALIAAARGEEAAASEAAAAGMLLANRIGAVWAAEQCRAALGLLELSRGDPAAALGHLLPAAAYVARAAIREPGAARFIPDAIEALILLDRLDEAEPLLAELEERATRLRRPSALAAAARCRALLLAAGGDLDGAVAALESALAHHARVPMPFELARKKRRAVESLERALAIFDELGARLWARQARTELSRIGGRRPASAGKLTPAELRVAELVAEGRSNQEVADLLFLSVKTVEWNLSKIFRKLGLRSRTELAARLGRSPADTRA